MAKNVISLLLLCVFICVGSRCISQIPISRERTAVIKAYSAQLGVREATGHNDGVQVEKFLSTVGLGKGYPWCAAFVKYCLLSAGISAASRITGAAASLYRTEYLVYDGQRFLGPALPADVFTLYFPSLKRIGHTGFFAGWANRSMATYFTTEGNTNGGGSRDGDGVYRRIRQLGHNTAISRWIN